MASPEVDRPIVDHELPADSPEILVPKQPASTDSLVTIRLSEPVSTLLALDEAEVKAKEEELASLRAETASVDSDRTVQPPSIKRVDSLDIINGILPNDSPEPNPESAEPDMPTTKSEPGTTEPVADMEDSEQTSRDAGEAEVETEVEPEITQIVPEPESGKATHRVRDSKDSQQTAEFPTFNDEDVFDASSAEPRSRSASSGSGSSDSSVVDWSELEKTEEGEQRDESTDESTAFLLARLEQENNALATDPRSGLKAAPKARKQSRPPSIQVLKKLVNNAPAKATRYSLLPNPPPMTELEFWAALVKDYPQTAQRLPTLTSNKIKAGVPQPLRGVVWMSLVGARDSELGDQFDKLSLETSPYEVLIGKDIGRSFPGVEMFREADGEGQAKLGRVLRCFSLYDAEIGYCQGLGFLVGPLLMHMGDKDAFCVLVKLMENYDLRSCFLPNLAGLHLRIYQFQRLLDQNMPSLAAHLKSMGVEAAYLSQWFLSFFAVTCPLPMLFRIFDVIFAEGASETIMRVALSLMRRNETKIKESKEFEEVMQLLLSRSLWEAYDGDADDLVNDFMEMTGLVSREKLKALETSFKAAHGGDPGAWFGFLPDATAAASRFMGRLWTATTPVKGGGLAPTQAAGSRPTSFLRRSPSKQSVAMSINSTDNNSDTTNNSVTTITTDGTAISRDSSGDTLSSTASKTESVVIVPATPGMSKVDRDLHGQIEDLLTALSDMQRQHAVISTQLQREREERCDDQSAIENLVDHLRSGKPKTDVAPSDRPQSSQYPPNTQESVGPEADRRRTVALPFTSRSSNLDDGLDVLVERANERLSQYRALQQSRSSQVMETKQRLRDDLCRSNDQLHTEIERSSSLGQQLDLQEKETVQVRERLRQTSSRLQDELKEKEKLEKSIQELRARIVQSDNKQGSTAWSDGGSPKARRSDAQDSRKSTASNGSLGGLRELRLGRPGSVLGTPAQTQSGDSIPKRTSSLATKAILSTEDHAPATEDNLLLELVNAKTSEATARQELEEVKAKLDSLRKMLGVPSPTLAQSNSHRASPSETPLAMPSAGSTTKPPTKQASVSEKSPTAATPGGISSIASNFWGGWGKRSASTTTAQVAAQTASQEPKP